MDQSNDEINIFDIDSDEERAYVKKYLINYVNETLEKYHDHIDEQNDEDGYKRQSIFFHSNPGIWVSKTVHKDTDEYTTYSLYVSDDLTYNGIVKRDTINFELDDKDGQYTVKTVTIDVRLADGESLIDNNYTSAEAHLDEIREIIKLAKKHEVIDIDPIYDYFDNPRLNTISTEVKDEEVSATIPEEETRISSEINEKMNEYVSSILGYMKDEELNYIIDHIKKEKQFSDEQIGELRGKLDYIKNERKYGFSEGDLARLNVLRAVDTIEDPWNPLGTDFWRDSYIVVDERSDENSAWIEALYIGRFLFKEFVAGLMG